MPKRRQTLASPGLSVMKPELRATPSANKTNPAIIRGTAKSGASMPASSAEARSTMEYAMLAQLAA